MNGHIPSRILSHKIFEDEMKEGRKITDGENLSEKSIKVRVGAKKVEKDWKTKGTSLEIKYM